MLFLEIDQHALQITISLRNVLACRSGHIQQRVKQLGKVIDERCASSKEAVLLTPMPGVGRFTAITLACRVSRVERFPRSRQLGQPSG